MTPSRVQLIDQALELTQQMLENAGANDWPQVIAQEAERRRLLEQAFSTREPLDAFLAARVRRVLELDKQLLQASTRLRDEVGGEIAQLKRGSRASTAYQANIA